MSSLERLQRERLRQHRLEPSRPITDTAAAEAFVRDRRIVVNTGGSSLAVLAWAIAGRQLSGSWMAHPEAHRIYDLIGSLAPPAFFPVRLIEGKYATVAADLAPSVERYAIDSGRVAQAEAELSSAQAELLAAVRTDGSVRMDGWAGTTSQRNALRRALDRRLLVVTEEVHADRGGAHIAVVRPWSAGAIAAAGIPAAEGDLDEAVDALVAAGLHSAVVAPVAEARRWLPEAANGLARLVERGEAVVVGDTHVVLGLTLHRLGA